MQLKKYVSRTDELAKTILSEEQAKGEKYTTEWVKVEDILKLLQWKIKYIEDNELYPAFGLNSQAEGIKSILDLFLPDSDSF